MAQSASYRVRWLFANWTYLLYGVTAWSIPFPALAFALLNFAVWRFVDRGLYDLRPSTLWGKSFP